MLSLFSCCSQGKERERGREKEIEIGGRMGRSRKREWARRREDRGIGEDNERAGRAEDNRNSSGQHAEDAHLASHTEVQSRTRVWKKVVGHVKVTKMSVWVGVCVTKREGGDGPTLGNMEGQLYDPEVT